MRSFDQNDEAFIDRMRAADVVVAVTLLDGEPFPNGDQIDGLEVVVASEGHFPVSVIADLLRYCADQLADRS